MLYNQNANYVYLDRPVNESIGMKAPNTYFSLALEQCTTKIAKCGSILEEETLLQNLKINCIPESVFAMDYTNYNLFLDERRVLMAQKIKDFYCKL